MTPPFGRLIGTGRGTGLPQTPDAPAGQAGLQPDLQALSQMVGLSQRLSVSEGARELTELTGSEEPDARAIPQAIQSGLANARGGNPRAYLSVMRLMAAQIPLLAENPEAQARERARALEIAGEAQQALMGATQLPLRERVRRLYDLILALAGALARPSREALPEAERRVLQGLFETVLRGLRENNAEADRNPQVAPLPPYLESYTQAQLALLAGRGEEAFRRLLETRRILEGLPESRTAAGGLRLQITISTELAIQGLPRDGSGIFAENFRSTLAAETLSYFYTVDYLSEHGESEAAVAQTHAQHYNLIAGLAIDHELTPNAATGRFATLDRAILIQALNTLYEVNPEFHRAADGWGLTGLNNPQTRDQAWEVVLENAQRVFSHIHGHREQEPYATVLRTSREQRRISRAIEQLGESGSQALRTALVQLVGATPEMPNRMLVHYLIEHGPLLPTLLNNLPEALRNNAEHRVFFETLRQAAQGIRSEAGLQNNITGPIQSYMEALEHLAGEHPEYAAAYAAVYQTIHETREIAPGIAFPARLRALAEARTQSLSEFSWGQAFRHVFTSPESIAMILGGSIFAELASIALVRRAGQAGELASLVRGGALTFRGHAAVGLGTAFGMSLASGITHCALSKRPFFEEMGRIGPGLALGTLLSGLALAGTMGINHRLATGLLSRSRISTPWLRGLSLRMSNIGIGTGTMLAAGSTTRGLMTGQWEMPSSQEVAETFLMMAAFDMTSWGIRRVGSRFWWRQQLGPLRAQQVERAAARSAERLRTSGHPEAEIDINGIRNFLGMMAARGQIPGARRSEGPSPSQLIRRVVESVEFQELMDSIHQEVVVRMRNNPNLETVWVQVTGNAENLQFRILNGETTAANRDPGTTFRVGPDGVPQDLQGLSDTTVREVLTQYGNQLTESGRAALRQRQFAGMPRSRPQLGGGTEVPRPPRPPAQSSMTTEEGAMIVMDLTPESRQVFDQIRGSAEFEQRLNELRIRVRNGLAVARDRSFLWVRGVRDGISVEFETYVDRPTPTEQEVSFQMHADGKITTLSDCADPVLRALIRTIPQSRVLPASAGAEEGERSGPEDATAGHRPGQALGSGGSRTSRRDPTVEFPRQRRRTGEAAGEETQGEERPLEDLDDSDVQMIEETAPIIEIPRVESGSHPALRPPPIPGEARTAPPPGQGGGSQSRRLPGLEPEDTVGLDMGPLLSNDAFMREVDRFSVELQGQTEPFIAVEITSPGAQFRLIPQSEFGANPQHGYFLLRRVMHGVASRPIGSFILHGEIALTPMQAEAGLKEFIQEQFAR